MSETELARILVMAIREQMQIYPAHRIRDPFFVKDDELTEVLVDGNVDFVQVARKILEKFGTPASRDRVPGGK